jgi:four helix bundle protein
MDNIAEGFDRGGNKEFVQFLFTSISSASESKSQLYRILDRNYISEDRFNHLYKDCDEVKKIISGLITYLSESDLKGRKFKNR